jgi:hypothetical protein
MQSNDPYHRPSPKPASPAIPEFPPGAAGRPRKKSSGCLKALGIGCLTMFVLAVAVGVAGFFAVRHYAGVLVNRYTATQPVEFPPSALSPQDATQLWARVQGFAGELKAGRTAQPIVLTADEINAMLHGHAEPGSPLRSLRIALEGDKVKAQVSLPLGDLHARFKGRYLNGAATLVVNLHAGRLAVYLDALEANGQRLPEQIMAPLRQENLAKDLNQDSDVAPVLARIESIEVKDERVILTPKAPGPEAAP